MGRSLRIVGGEVYDPANGINGTIKEICVEDGKIVESCTGPAEVIDAANLVVMPGGVDIHTHIASPAVNAARGFRPEAYHGSGAMTRSPSPLAWRPDFPGAPREAH